MTPFILQMVNDLTRGQSLQASILLERTHPYRDPCPRCFQMIGALDVVPSRYRSDSQQRQGGQPDSLRAVRTTEPGKVGGTSPARKPLRAARCCEYEDAVGQILSSPATSNHAVSSAGRGRRNKRRFHCEGENGKAARKDRGRRGRDSHTSKLTSSRLLQFGETNPGSLFQTFGGVGRNLAGAFLTRLHHRVYRFTPA